MVFVKWLGSKNDTPQSATEVREKEGLFNVGLIVSVGVGVKDLCIMGISTWIMYFPVLKPKKNIAIMLNMKIKIIDRDVNRINMCLQVFDSSIKGAKFSLKVIRLNSIESFTIVFWQSHI